MSVLVLTPIKLQQTDHQCPSTVKKSQAHWQSSHTPNPESQPRDYRKTHAFFNNIVLNQSRICNHCHRFSEGRRRVHVRHYKWTRLMILLTVQIPMPGRSQDQVDRASMANVDPYIPIHKCAWKWTQTLCFTSHLALCEQYCNVWPLKALLASHSHLVVVV